MADKEDGERRPLLQNEQQADLPPEYTPIDQGQAAGFSSQNDLAPLQGFAPPQAFASAPPQQVTVPPIGQNELPPPYTPTPNGGAPMINCKICQAMVSLEGKANQHVVKCQVCNEATPIKAAPPGKKYVRCPCNCLLICRATAQKIACPRATWYICWGQKGQYTGRTSHSNVKPADVTGALTVGPRTKRIINLGGPGTFPTVTVRSPGTNRVQCTYCNQTFLFATVTTPLARCPHCRRVSSVASGFARNRGLAYLIVGLVFLGAGIGVTVGTYEMASNAGGIYTVWIGAFVVGLIFIIRSIYLLNIRTSNVIGPAA